MHIAIIGNGISGITAARFLRKQSNHRITVISEETDYFFSRTALMYIYMGHMRFKDTQAYEPWFWEKNKIELVRAKVESIDSKKKILSLTSKRDIRMKVVVSPGHVSVGETLQYDKLIIACGSKPNRFGWSGQNLDQVHGLYSYQDLERMEEASTNGIQQAVIVGGGLIGIEMAEMFHSRHIPVTLLVREKNYWNGVLPSEESKMVNRHIVEHGIDLRLNTELKEIIDDGTGKAGAVITNKGDRIDCQYVGLTAGVSPNIKFLEGSGIETKRGILVNEHLETNISDIYAIGDCCEQRAPLEGRRSVEAVWYTGRMMGETVAYNICGKPIAYNPGIWFNSAKFLDIEYQVYGTVLANAPDDHQSIYWEQEDGKRSIRLIYDKKDRTIIGFNLMGIRYRHEVCEKWIAEKTSIETVLQNLSLANFDPEFYKEYEADVLAIYNKQTGKNLQLQKKRRFNSVFNFLKSK